MATPVHRSALEEAWALVQTHYACSDFETLKGTIKETFAYTGLRHKRGLPEVHGIIL